MKSNGETNNYDDADLTLDELLTKAKALLSNDNDSNDNDSNDNANNDGNSDKNVLQAVHILTSLQDKIHSAALFSTNESLDDISTSSLSLLSVEYYLAKAYLQLPMYNHSNNNHSKSRSAIRFQNVNKSIEYFHLFLGKCHSYQSPSLFNDTLQQYYTNLLSIHEDYHSSTTNNKFESSLSPSIPSSSSYNYTLPPQSRDEKINQYQQTKNISTKINNYKAKLNQRHRLSISQNDIFDGYDYDTLLRTLIVEELNLYGLDSITEIYSTSLELQMLQMAMTSEQQQRHADEYRYGHNDNKSGNQIHSESNQQSQSQSQPYNYHHHQKLHQHKPLTLTHITQNPITNTLQIQKETISKSIFRPSWNQPTKTLEQLAIEEVQAAQERSVKEKQNEIDSRNKPRRYEYLVRDGLEDDDKLVDASAKLDRNWDDWKDENPRGSGNKMGDVGDRNF